MLVTRNATCQSCGVTLERQMDDSREHAPCSYCGGRTTLSKPQRHNEPGRAMDTTPHDQKNAVGGY